MNEQKTGQPGMSQVHMVDTSTKPITLREATARGMVRMQRETMEMLRLGRVPKGDVLAVARVAGIMAAKQTPQLIPLCHPLVLDEVAVDFVFDSLTNAVGVSATVKCTGRTGVEMEALVAVTVSALTIYDMCKPIDPAMKLDNIRLVRKSGGKSRTVVLE
ncbi:MAG: cyclic pyranopterin monophosphate synthase MoaC [Chloroflexi bacterium]|nr:cyclic pyranopterin monophosphate synthase MoaC [Chloroflexota bacterium]